MIAQNTWVENLRIGLVSYASSARPIRKAMVHAASIPRVSECNRTRVGAKNKEYTMRDSRNTIKKVIPPIAGFDTSLQRIIFSLFRIPRVFENLRKRLFISIDNTKT